MRGMGPGQKKILCMGFLWSIGFWISGLLFPTILWSDTRVGMEGILGKREDGDRVYVPQGWVDVSVSYYVSESFSLFGDFSAKVGWDTGMDSFPYDVSGSLSGSLRGDSFFIGLEGGLRGTRSYDSPRQLEAYLSSNLSYVMEESSLFLKPFVQTVLGPTDSITFALEPGIERLLGEGWMVALSFRPSITYYSDESSEVSLEPRLTLDWFPSVPFTANLRGGWSQRWSDNSDVLQESVFGALELIWYPALNTILRLDTIVEQVYRGMYTLNKGLTISSNMEIRLGLPFPKNSWDLIFGGGYQWKIYSEDPQASDEWFVRVGFEVKL